MNCSWVRGIGAVPEHVLTVGTLPHHIPIVRYKHEYVPPLTQQGTLDSGPIFHTHTFISTGITSHHITLIHTSTTTMMDIDIINPLAPLNVSAVARPLSLSLLYAMFIHHELLLSALTLYELSQHEDQQRSSETHMYLMIMCVCIQGERTSASSTGLSEPRQAESQCCAMNSIQACGGELQILSAERAIQLRENAKLVNWSLENSSPICVRHNNRLLKHFPATFACSGIGCPRIFTRDDVWREKHDKIYCRTCDSRLNSMGTTSSTAGTARKRHSSSTTTSSSPSPPPAQMRRMSERMLLHHHHTSVHARCGTRY